MAVKITEWERTVSWGTAIEVTANKVINLLLRSEDNLIKLDENEIYVDLQLESWIQPSDTFPVWVTTGRVIQNDWWIATGTLLVFKTTSWDYVTWIYWDDGKLYIDNGTWTFKQIYLKPEVDALFAQLRSELATVAFTGSYNDLLNKPTLGTASALDVGTDPGDIPVIQQNGRLDPAIVPNVTSHTFIVSDVSDLITLSQASQWDMAIVTNASATYILSADPYSTASNWILLPTPTSDVTSVNGQRWDVVLTTNDVAEANNKLYTSSLEKGTWNAKLGVNDVATVAISWAYADLSWKPVVDTQLNAESTNAVQNQAIATSVNTINGDISTINTTLGTVQGDITTINGNIDVINQEIQQITGEVKANVYVTQTQYDNLPSTKESDWNSYFIFRT